jgi:predicted phage tail protein
MILGGKNGGIFGIILGAVLVGAAIVATGGVAAAFAGGIWGAVATAGVAMVAGGVAQLLTPMPKGLSSADKPANTPNYSFNGPINTQA